MLGDVEPQKITEINHATFGKHLLKCGFKNMENLV